MSLFTRSVFTLSLAAVTANAAIVISNVGVAPSGPNFLWSYTFSVQPDQSMRQTCAGTCTLTNDYGILYDFPGYIAASANVVGLAAGKTFSLTEQNSGDNPPFQAPPDNAGLPNFIVRLTAGGDIVPAGSAVEAFRLELLSSLGQDLSSPNQLFFGGQARNTATTLTAGNSGQILGPGRAPEGTTGGEVPEPATMSMLGGGLAILGAVRLRGNRRAA